MEKKIYKNTLKHLRIKDSIPINLNFIRIIEELKLKAVDLMKSFTGNIHISAIFDNKYKILSIGTNMCANRRHTIKWKSQKCSEVDCMHNLLFNKTSSRARNTLKKRIKTYRMIVLRVDKDGVIKNSEPCCVCQQLKKKFGFKLIFPYHPIDDKKNLYFTSI